MNNLTAIKLKRRVSRILKSHNKKNFKIIRVNIQKNSVNGILFIENKKFFFKLLDHENGEKEIKGYNSLIEKYPISEMDSVMKDYDDILILYDYEKTISPNKGLLSDEINKNLHRKINLNKIFEIWKKNFNESVRWGFKLPGNSSFFNDRIKKGGRYDQWYGRKKILIDNKKISFKDILRKKYIINGTEIKSNPYEIFKGARKLFSKRRKIIELISQGDPIEMNIGMKPVFFDFENAGLDDFFGETAIFIYSILIDGGYFSPRYHKNAFWMHKKLISNAKKHSYKFLRYHLYDKEVTIDYKLKIPEVRTKILKQYFQEIIKPILRKSKLSLEKYSDLMSYYLFLRFMCVHDITKMGKRDMFLSLAMACEIKEYGLIKFLEKFGIKV